jgi:hypothetical protein
MNNEDLYDAALEAIKRLFSDQTVSPDTAIENLRGLKDEIDSLE